MASPLSDAAFPAQARLVLPRIHALFWLNALLIALRIATAAHLPLSFDESYFWLWSKHLALSYYDHPPLIALTIRAGTALFGDSEIGVRAFSLLCSVASSWALWRAGALLAGSEEAGALACSLFNVTLMANSQLLAATPDALVITAAAFLLFSLAKLQTTDDGRWWLAAAGALGMALLSKYTAFFLVAGTGLWCAVSQQGRRWLRTPWPYIAAVVAALCFMPALIWNAAHGWISFKFQFGRVTAGGIGYRHALEFALAQIALASPFILAAAVAGLYRAGKAWRDSSPMPIAAALVLPAAVYFIVHAFHDRVQGNWPSFIYPALCILAAYALSRPLEQLSSALRITKRLAFPVALVILTAAYVQTWTGAIVAGKRDPIARMMGIGVKDAAGEIATLAAQQHAAAILTGKYVVTGWLSFYLPRGIAVVQIADEQRWLETPKAGSALLQRPWLYVTQEPSRELGAARKHFFRVILLRRVARRRGAAPLDSFYVYSLAGFHGPGVGRVVYGKVL